MALVARLKLSDLIKRAGISQRELSRRTGVRQPSIVEMCNGTCKHLPLDNLAKICDVLGVGVSDIIEIVRVDQDTTENALER